MDGKVNIGSIMKGWGGVLSLSGNGKIQHLPGNGENVMSAMMKPFRGRYPSRPATLTHAVTFFGGEVSLPTHLFEENFAFSTCEEVSDRELTSQWTMLDGENIPPPHHSDSYFAI